MFNFFQFLNVISTEIIPNSPPFQNHFWLHENNVIGQELFTVASFVTMTLGVLFALVVILAVLYWYANADEDYNSGDKFGRLHH